MSFPPRFGIPAQFVGLPYGTVSMVPVMRATHYIVPTIANAVISAPPRPLKKKEPLIEKPPPSTVFVGNIHEKASNDLMRALFYRCGPVSQWKRVHGSNGRFQAFGFCEFDNPDSTLRAIRLLNEFNLGGKKLVIKCDEKTRDIIKEYVNKRRMLYNKPLLKTSNVEDIPREEFAQESQTSFWQSLKKLVQDANEPELLLEEGDEVPVFESKASTTSQLILPETEEAEKDKLQYIEREIKQFRSTHKDSNKPAVASSSKRRRHPRSQSKSPDGTGDASKRRPTVDGKDGVSRSGEEGVSSSATKDAVTPSTAAPSVTKDAVTTSSAAIKHGTKSSPSVAAAPTTVSTGGGATSPISSRASSATRRSPSGAAAGGRRRDDRRVVSSTSRRRSRSRRPESRGGASPTTGRRRSRSQSRSRRHDSGDEEELLERKQIERKIREKEYAYQERLRKWEAREQKKSRECEKQKKHVKQQRKEEIREARKLKEFFEDYDDETEDVKYYRGKSYDIRRRDYERQRELDSRDRQKERDELDEIRRKLLSEGVEDPEKEISRIQNEQEVRLLKRLRVDSSDSGANSPQHEAHPATPSPSQRRHAEGVNASHVANDGEDGFIDSSDVPYFDLTAVATETLDSLNAQWRTVNDHAEVSSMAAAVEPSPCYEAEGSSTPAGTAKTMGFASLRLTAPSSSSSSSRMQNHAVNDLSLSGVRLDGSATANAEPSARRPLVPLEYSEEETRAVHELASLTGLEPGTATADFHGQAVLSSMTVEDKRKAIKALIEKIPTNKEELFAYQINWPLVDSSLIEKRLKPWVNKKIVEYIGEEEVSLVDFICQKVSEHSSPQSILEDISMVLDDEASVFVVKLWRLLIYEIEAKRYGLVKID